jgi:hypothetical protein
MSAYIWWSYDCLDCGWLDFEERTVCEGCCGSRLSRYWMIELLKASGEPVSSEEVFDGGEDLRRAKSDVMHARGGVVIAWGTEVVEGDV